MEQVWWTMKTPDGSEWTFDLNHVSGWSVTSVADQSRVVLFLDGHAVTPPPAVANAAIAHIRERIAQARGKPSHA